MENATGENPATLEHLDGLAGTWRTEATHPMRPGAVISGTTSFEWLEGRRFLIWRAHHDHPDSLSVIGVDGAGDAASAAAPEGECVSHYFDSRGVSRVYKVDADATSWRFWRDWPGFSQRFTGRFSEDGETITGTGELCQDGTTWQPDLRITCRRER
ncbi:MAG TPA: hypothetical protein VHN99_11410 [Deinococcales bacterium]|nr:hypothetical protein [Deinococcales bacterium]